MGNIYLTPKLESYLRLLSTVARPLGLIGFDDEKAKEQVERCTLLTQLIDSAGLIIDVGTGAGLPGIPVALTLEKIYPNAHSTTPFEVILIEPKRKAISFLEKVVRELGLKNVTIYAGRAEQAATNLAETGDWVLAKAVAPPTKILTMCMPLCRPGGAVVIAAPSRRPAEMTAPGLQDIQYRVLRGDGAAQSVIFARKARS